MAKLAASLSGEKLSQNAHNMTAAVNKIGGASKLTEREQARVNATLTKALDKYKAMGKDAPAAMVELEKATRRAEAPTTALSVAVGVLAADLAQKAGRAVVAFGKEALLSSARVESLAGVARFMGAQAGYSAGEINALAGALQRQGITSEQSYNTIIQMVRANLSLADATNLATVAQSLARATGQNSSETLGKLIQGTQTLQVEVLRNAGVVIQLDQEYKKFAETNDRTVASLSAQEKQQIALAAVIREGERVAGVYGVTNEFVGGKIQSMTRHQEEASKAIGDVFKPALSLGVDVLTSLLKIVREAPVLFGGLGLSTVALAGSFTALKGAAALGVISTTSLTTGLGLLWPAVAVGATAFAAWELGKWIGEVSGLTDWVERLAGRMMGLSEADIEAGMAARKYVESAEGKAAVLAAQAAELENLEKTARAADDAERQLAIADAKAEAAARAHAKAVKTLAAEMQAYEDSILRVTEAQAAQVATIGNTLFGYDDIERARQYADAIGDVDNISRMNAETQREVAEVMRAGIEALVAAGLSADEFTGHLEVLRLKATETGRDAAFELQRIQVEAANAAAGLATVLQGLTIIGQSPVTLEERNAEGFQSRLSQRGVVLFDDYGNAYEAPARARGGPVTAGQPYTVGERGPELFVPKVAGTVLPTGAGGSPVTVNVNVGHFIGSDESAARQLAAMVSGQVMQTLATTRKLDSI